MKHNIGRRIKGIGGKKICPVHKSIGCYCDPRPDFFKSDKQLEREYLKVVTNGASEPKGLRRTDMDERELNKAVCQIFVDYRETPHAVPQKIVDLIIKDRLRVVHGVREIQDIKELYDVVNKHLKHMGAVQTISLPIMISEIQDIIIADRLRIVESLIKYKQGFTDFSPYAGCHKAINETLNLAGVNNDKTN